MSNTTEVDAIFDLVDLAIKRGKHKIAVETLKDCIKQAVEQLAAKEEIIQILSNEIAELKRKNSL